MKRLSGTLTWGATMLLLVALMGWVIHVLGREPSPLERKVAESERLIYYAVRPGVGPRFRLAGTERRLRIISHAVVDHEGPYDPAWEVAYGIRATLWSSAGEKLWEREIHTRSRQSKAEPRDGIWLEENAFTLDGSFEVADDRVHVLHLPDDGSSDRLLVLSLVDGVAPEALVRVYNVLERTEGQRRRRLLTLGAGAREGLDDDLSYVPWDQLAERDRLDRLRFRPVLMSAIGKSGIDHETRTLYDSGFRLPRRDATRWTGLHVHRAHAVAVNVEGPADLRLRAWRAAPPAGGALFRGGAAPGGRLTVRVVGADGGVETSKLAFPEGESGLTEVPLSIRPGVGTVRFSTRHRAGVRVQLLARRTAKAQFGSLAGIPHPEGTLLVPEARRSSLYRVGPDGPEVVARVEGPGDVAARVVRVETRFLLDPESSLDDTPVTGEMRYTMRDAEGRVVGERAVHIASPVAPFEQIYVGADEVLPVTEPVSFRLVVPAAVHEVALLASRPATVRLMTPLAGEPRLRPPFDRVAEREVEWRHAPREFRFWHGIRAANHRPLLEAGRWVRLEAQVRLEPRVREGQGPERDTVALEPLGHTDRQVVLEPVGAPADLASWTASHYAPLAAGEPASFYFGDGPDPARLLYSLADPTAIGPRVEVHVDGEPTGGFDLGTASGSLALPSLTAGPHSIEIVSDAVGLALHLNRPRLTPDGAIMLPVVRRRTVHRLGAEPVRFLVERPAGEELTVAAILYGPTPEAMPDVSIRTRIDDGDPPRVEGEPLALYSVSDWVRSLPAAGRDEPARLRARELGLAGWPRRLPVFLGADLESGSHVVQIENRSDAPLWVRAYVTFEPGQLPARAEPALQWSLARPDLAP